MDKGLTKAEQQTWDLLTWVNEVDIDTLEFDAAFDESDFIKGDIELCLCYGELKNGKVLTNDQLDRFALYKPDIVQELAMYYWDWQYDNYMGG